MKVLALTASATNTTFTVVCQRLSMVKPILVGLPPYRHNIHYAVESKPKMSDFTALVTKDIIHQGSKYPKTIIFCQTYHDCADLYHMFRRLLGMYFTFPPNFPDFHQFRVVEMFTRASSIEMKEKVLHSFCASGSIVRIILATTAFGMGINCHDIRKIIHWGPPNTLEQYVQESGQAGRDNLPSEACILYGSPGRHVDDNVKQYAENKEKCRREHLFKNFLFSSSLSKVVGCKCSDVCARSCICADCCVK